MHVVVHVAASSGVTRVELMSLSRLDAGRGKGDSHKGSADGLGDGSHDDVDDRVLTNMQVMRKICWDSRCLRVKCREVAGRQWRSVERV